MQATFSTGIIKNLKGLSYVDKYNTEVALCITEGISGLKSSLKLITHLTQTKAKGGVKEVKREVKKFLIPKVL